MVRDELHVAGRRQSEGDTQRGGGKREDRSRNDVRGECKNRKRGERREDREGEKGREKKKGRCEGRTKKDREWKEGELGARTND